MRISDWSSDVCSSDLVDRAVLYRVLYVHQPDDVQRMGQGLGLAADFRDHGRLKRMRRQRAGAVAGMDAGLLDMLHDARSEEHTSELQSLMRISYAVFCLTKTKN